MAGGSGRSGRDRGRNPVVNLGDVHWVDLPDRGGHEQRGRRPAIIWQDTSAFLQLPTALIIPLTSRLDALRFPAVWRIDPTPANGLNSPSVALVFQLGASDVRRIGQRLGTLNDADLQAIQTIARKLQRLTSGRGPYRRRRRLTFRVRRWCQLGGVASKQIQMANDRNRYLVIWILIRPICLGFRISDFVIWLRRVVALQIKVCPGRGPLQFRVIKRQRAVEHCLRFTVTLQSLVNPCP